ncbi:hypothetical protein LCGC14_0625430 [marine sediment metagenome]|uniref:Uncharacterized protein n=1 Tax=marine sediment metagenome TaxID=412755 RepID=A0A0F9UC00_9ZZZZ|nr:MAG: hypothetical protein Lokiarch_04180 [Candidatus Lokiarchaeum sp. GC14_75]HEA70573.1 hypothetical protein [archaeon]
MMNSKKIRIIKLKDPQLRRVRKNLRDIIKLAAKDEIKRLLEITSNCLKKGKDISSEEQIKFTQYSRECNQLMSALSSSIIQCSSGAECDSLEEAIKQGFNPKDRPTDLDMVWIPYYQKLFCLKCYESTFYDSTYRNESEDPYADPYYKDSCKL